MKQVYLYRATIRTECIDPEGELYYSEDKLYVTARNHDEAIQLATPSTGNDNEVSVMKLCKREDIVPCLEGKNEDV